MSIEFGTYIAKPNQPISGDIGLSGTKNTYHEGAAQPTNAVPDTSVITAHNTSKNIEPSSSCGNTKYSETVWQSLYRKLHALYQWLCVCFGNTPAAHPLKQTMGSVVKASHRTLDAMVSHDQTHDDDNAINLEQNHDSASMSAVINKPESNHVKNLADASSHDENFETSDQATQELSEVAQELNDKLQTLHRSWQQAATKEDFKKLATKEDLKGLATKQQFDELCNGLHATLEDVKRELISLIAENPNLVLNINDIEFSHDPGSLMSTSLPTRAK